MKIPQRVFLSIYRAALHCYPGPFREKYSEANDRRGSVDAGRVAWVCTSNRSRVYYRPFGRRAAAPHRGLHQLVIDFNIDAHFCLDV